MIVCVLGDLGEISVKLFFERRVSRSASERDHKSTHPLMLAVLSILAMVALPTSAIALQFTNYTTANGLGNNLVYGVFASESTVYAATFGNGTTGGLSISTNGGGTFTNYTTANGLDRNNVQSVYAVGSTIYAGTFGGLSISTTPTTQAIPSLSEWTQLMLGLMVMMLIGWHFHRERSY